MPKPPRNQPPTEPSNPTFDFVSRVPPQPSKISAPSTAPRMPDTARESHAPWQAHPTQSSPTPPTPALPQGYKQTEVGVIPEEWRIAQLQQIAILERGKFSARPRNDPKYYGGNTPFLQTGDVSNSNGRVDTYSQSLNDEGIKVSKLFPSGTLFFTIAANIADIGIANFDAACPDSLVGITPLSNTNRFWLAFLLRSKKSSFENLATSNAQRNLNLEKLGPYPIPLPPLEEQEAIAEALSDADALVDALERLLWKKRRIKEGAMQELLTGRTRLPGFNGAWETKRLGEVFDVSGGLSASRAQLGDEGYCYLHYGDIHSSSRAFISVFEEFSVLPKLPIGLKNVPLSAMLKDGDVVFVDASEDEEGASKHIVVVNPRGQPFISGLHTIVAKSKTAHLCNLYKRYCFQTSKVKEQFRFYSVGTKVLGVNKSNIVKISILVPPLEEQEAIAEVLCGMDEEIEALEEKLAKARMVKQGMMQELLTGRIRLQ